MKMLTRLCAAATVAITLVGCGDAPTAAKTEIPPARRDGGGFAGGGHRTGDADSTSVNTVSSDPTTTGDTCLDERGGGFAGGGHLTVTTTCE